MKPVTKALPSLLSAKSESAPALLDRLRRGDREAFEVLYEVSFLRVYGYFCRRLRTEAAAERATEAALTVIFSTASTGRLQLPLWRWIFSHVRAVEARVRRALPDAVSA
jgi:hypothetical protein